MTELNGRASQNITNSTSSACNIHQQVQIIAESVITSKQAEQFIHGIELKSKSPSQPIRHEYWTDG
ncbi:3446_t:CDS:1, partial [Acaulospora colombiana]